MTRRQVTTSYLIAETILLDQEEADLADAWRLVREAERALLAQSAELHRRREAINRTRARFERQPEVVQHPGTGKPWD